MKCFTIQLDSNRVRFTPDGKIAVFDAIKALSGRQGAKRIWSQLKADHPEFNNIGERYKFQEGQMELVAGGESWKKIEAALTDFILDPCHIA